MGYEEYISTVRILFLILVFLIAIQTVLTLWSQVGGQSHLDMMFWPWKLGLTLAAATLITLIAREARTAGRILTRRSLLCLSLLIAVMAVAGVVTFYYHQNEASDEEQDVPAQQTHYRSYQTLQEFSARTIG